MDLSKLFYSFAANLPTAFKDPFLVLEEPYILYPYTAGFNIVVVFIKNMKVARCPARLLACNFHLGLFWASAVYAQGA